MKTYKLQDLSNDSLMIVMYFCDIQTISRLRGHVYETRSEIIRATTIRDNDA